MSKNSIFFVNIVIIIIMAIYVRGFESTLIYLLKLIAFNLFVIAYQNGDTYEYIQDNENNNDDYRQA